MTSLTLFGLPFWCCIFFAPALTFIFLAVFYGISGLIQLDAVRKGRALEFLGWGIGTTILTAGALFFVSFILKRF